MYQFVPHAIAAVLSSNLIAVAPAHAASCTVDHQPAAIARAIEPEYPALAKLEHLTGTSVIRVDLADDGSVVGSYLSVSSGSPLLDQAAIKAAKTMVYAPETQACKPVAGSYAVEVEFAD